MKQKFTFVLLLFFFVIQSVVAQNVRVAGVVIGEEDGEPVIGASVVVKGTTQGTVTNYDGEFSLEVSRNAVLQISYVGMRMQEVTAQPQMRILLASDSQALSEVVVVAYGQQRREAITGAVANIKSESIERRPIAVATAALEGQALGVQVNNGYGEPGSTPQIRIRGFNSINGDNAPLYVINGVPLGGSVEDNNPLADINPADIESISVLKDASSAALYGNKAANGVILITTKGGRMGQDNLEMQVNINQGFYSRGTKEYKRLNPYQYMDTYWQSRRNALYTDDQSKSSPKYSTWADANPDALPVVMSGIGERYNIFNKDWDNLFDSNGKLAPGTEIGNNYKDDLDWYDGLERTGYRGEYNVNARGGSKKATYYMSVGYLTEEGFMKHSGSERLTGNAKVDVTPTSWLKTGINLNGSIQEYDKMTASSVDNATSYINPFYAARNMAPIFPVHLHDPATGEYLLDVKGDRQYDGGTNRLQSNNRHIIWETELNKDKTYRSTLDGTAYADVKFLNDFVLSIKGNLNSRSSTNKTYDNSLIGDGSGQGRMKQVEYRYKNYLFQQLLNWKRTFNKVHNVEALIGHENFYYNYQYSYLYKTDEKFANIMELSNFTTFSSVDGYQNGYKTEGYFSRVGYNYDYKYFGEFSFRRDGSSRFHKDHRWGNFWSLGGSWIASEEEFIKQNEWIDYLKLRAAYGEVGQDSGVGYYGWMALYTSTQNGGNGAYYKGQELAKELGWEKAKSMSFALESSLFRRVNFNVEYYDKTSEDLLFEVSLPTSIGATDREKTRPTITRNLGSVSNRGVEIGFDVDIIQTKEWTWNVGMNLNYLKNKILKLPEEYGNSGYISGTKRYLKGHSIYDFWLYKFAGIDREDGRSLYLVNDEEYTVNPEDKDKILLKKGEYKVIDGVTYVYNSTNAKKDWSGTSIPKVYGSFTTSLKYKDFQLSALFTYQLGAKALDRTYRNLMIAAATPSALHSDILKAWSPEKAGTGIDPNGIPIVNTSQSTNNNFESDRFLISTNYLNIKNITFSYSLPKSFISPIGLKGLLVTASMDNVYLFSKRQGMDPQQSWNGIINNGYPPARIMTFGLNVKF